MTTKLRVLLLSQCSHEGVMPMMLEPLREEHVERFKQMSESHF
jgi:hypothetical protein